MSFEDQVVALIEEGNPISDPATLDIDPRQSAAYMAELAPGGRLQKAPGEPSPMVRRGIGWAAVIVVAAVLGIALFQTTQPEVTPPATNPLPTTTVAPAPTTTPPPTTATPPSSTSTTSTTTTLPDDGSVGFAQFTLGELRFIPPSGIRPSSSHPGIVDVPVTDRSGIIFMAPQQYTSGEPITDAASYVQTIASRTDVSDGPAATILGQDLAALLVAERSAIPSISVLPVGVDPGQAFQSPAPAGYDYLIDTPAGLLIVGLYASDVSELPAVEEVFADLIATIELVPPA